MYLTGVLEVCNLLYRPLQNVVEVVAGREFHQLIHQHGGQGAGPEQSGLIVCRYTHIHVYSTHVLILINTRTCTLQVHVHMYMYVCHLLV